LYVYDGSSWGLSLNAGLSDFVDLIPTVGLGFLAITGSGDLVLISGGSASLIGNIGLSGVVSSANKNDTIYIITEYGDVVRSVDGTKFSLIGTISQTGINGLCADKNDTLYTTSIWGEVAGSNDGINWDWKGSANQPVIAGIISDSLSILGEEEVFFTLSVMETGILIRFTGSHYWDIYRAEKGKEFEFLKNISGSYEYLDKDVEPGKTYGYKIFSDGKWFGPVWIEFPERFRERILSVYPNISEGRFYVILRITGESLKKIFICDESGRKKYIYKGFLYPGTYKIKFELKRKAGIYFIIFGGDREKIVIR